MIDKIANSVADAMAGTPDGATVLIGGFGTAGIQAPKMSPRSLRLARPRISRRLTRR